MKRSRIICSIITVIYIILSVALTLLLLKSNVTTESSLNANVKAIHIAVFGVCTLMYIFVKNKLAKKMSNKSLSIKISKIYCYLYLAVIVFVSRLVMVYVLKDSAVNEFYPSFNIGIGSYINYGLGLVVNNQLYANVIINAILAFVSCILIKKIILNITENDTVATVTSILYLLLPQALAYVTEYVKYSYNVVIILIGIFVYIKIIDETKNFNKKSNKYLIYSLILGVIQSIDIILGGSYVLWICILLFTTIAAMYVDIVRVVIEFKDKLSYKLKRIAEKIENINISKLVYVSLVSLVVSGITTLIYGLVSKVTNYSLFSVQNSINILMHSRNYYLVLIICSLVFEIIGVILRRKLDIKMFVIKVTFIASGIITFFAIDGIYASAVFDTTLVLTVITNICNICYNREERIKLLKDKN